MAVKGGRLQSLNYPELPPEIKGTFREGKYEPAWVPIGTDLYRYGSDESHATWSRNPWVFLTEECFEYGVDVVEYLSLLDATLHGMTPMKGGKYTGVWNTAAWRCALRTVQNVPAYVGYTAALSFDLFSAKVYRGPGDQLPHRTTGGGAVQVVVPGCEFDAFTWTPPIRLPTAKLQT